MLRTLRRRGKPSHCLVRSLGSGQGREVCCHGEERSRALCRGGLSPVTSCCGSPLLPGGSLPAPFFRPGSQAPVLKAWGFADFSYK